MAMLDSAKTTIAKEKPHPEPARLDGGKRAWLFLVAAVVIEGMLYGFLANYGVFLKYYQTHTSFGSNPFLPVIGPLGLGIGKLLSPVSTYLTLKYLPYRPHMIWGGWILCIVSLVASSCATELWSLALSQGVAFSIGFSVLYYPLLTILNEWWVERRGFAYGVLFGAGGIIATVVPIITDELLTHIGSGWTLQAHAIAVFITVGPTLFYLQSPPQAQNQNTKPTTLRTTKIPTRTPKKLTHTTLFKNPTYNYITLSNTFQSLVFYLPTVFLPTYGTTAINLSPLLSTILLSITNITTTISQIAIGYLADMFSPLILMSLSSFLSAITVYLFWGLTSDSLIRLLSFGVLYGLASGGYSVLCSRFATMLAPDGDVAGQNWLFTVFDVQRGVGIIVGGVVSGNLVSLGGGLVQIGSYGVGMYRVLILFVGTSFLVSALGGVGWFYAPKGGRRPGRNGDGGWGPDGDGDGDEIGDGNGRVVSGVTRKRASRWRPQSMGEFLSISELQLAAGIEYGNVNDVERAGGSGGGSGSGSGQEQGEEKKAVSSEVTKQGQNDRRLYHLHPLLRNSSGGVGDEEGNKRRSGDNNNNNRRFQVHHNSYRSYRYSPHPYHPRLGHHHRQNSAASSSQQELLGTEKGKAGTSFYRTSKEGLEIEGALL